MAGGVSRIMNYRSNPDVAQGKRSRNFFTRGIPSPAVTRAMITSPLNRNSQLSDGCRRGEFARPLLEQLLYDRLGLPVQQFLNHIQVLGIHVTG